MAKGVTSPETIKARREFWAAMPENTLQRTAERAEEGKEAKVTTVDLRPLWECEDLAVLRSYAAASVSKQARANAPEGADAIGADIVVEVLSECAGVKGFGAEKAPGVTAMLKAQLAEQQAAIAALQNAMASGDKNAIKAAMQALAALKA